MKKLFLIITFLLAVCMSEANTSDPAFSVSGGGRTDLLNRRYQVKAWVGSVSSPGNVLTFISSVSFSKAVLLRWTKNAQGKIISDQLTTSFNPTTGAFTFNLDSPAYKGGLMYDLLLYVNAGDSEKEYAWRIHLIKQ